MRYAVLTKASQSKSRRQRQRRIRNDCSSLLVGSPFLESSVNIPRWLDSCPLDVIDGDDRRIPSVDAVHSDVVPVPNDVRKFSGRKALRVATTAKKVFMLPVPPNSSLKGSPENSAERL